MREIVAKIRIETLRLVKGENKQWKQDFKQSNNPARQIIHSTDNITPNVYFAKKES